MKISKLKILFILSFFFNLHIALSSFINSSFLSQVINEKFVGIIYVFASLVTLFLLSRNADILKNLGNRLLTFTLLILNMISLFYLITSDNVYAISLSLIIFLSTNSLILLCIDIFMEHFSRPDNVGRNRSFYLIMLNLAWLVSPLVSTFLISKEGGYKAVYSLSLIATFIMTAGLFFTIKTFKDKTYKKIPPLEAYNFLKKNPHMLAITIINFILQFFYAWMVVYSPIYLHEHIGLAWPQIGIIFTIMLLPFVLFGLPIGTLIDKYHISKRYLLYIGFAIIVGSTFAIAFIQTKEIWHWAMILFATRIGACFIETTSEIYFFTHIKEEETYLLGIFRDMSPVAYLIAPLIATLLLEFMPFKNLFIALSVILLTGFYYIPRLKHNHVYAIPDQNK